MALIKSSVAAAMKIKPPAVIMAPPLLGVPILNGSIEGMPKGPLRRAVPNGRSHNCSPVSKLIALMPPYGGSLHNS